MMIISSWLTKVPPLKFLLQKERSPYLRRLELRERIPDSNFSLLIGTVNQAVITQEQLSNEDLIRIWVLLVDNSSLGLLGKS